MVVLVVCLFSCLFVCLGFSFVVVVVVVVASRFKIQEYFIISPEKLKRGRTLTTSFYFYSGQSAYLVLQTDLRLQFSNSGTNHQRHCPPAHKEFTPQSQAWTSINGRFAGWTHTHLSPKCMAVGCLVLERMSLVTH